MRLCRWTGPPAARMPRGVEPEGWGGGRVERALWKDVEGSLSDSGRQAGGQASSGPNRMKVNQHRHTCTASSRACSTRMRLSFSCLLNSTCRHTKMRGGG